MKYDDDDGMALHCLLVVTESRTIRLNSVWLEALRECLVRLWR